MKKAKPSKEWHSSNKKMGMGDYYGSGIKNPIGKVRDSYMTPKMTSKKLGKAPKSLA
jgi:hypothetical protein